MERLPARIPYWLFALICVIAVTLKAGVAAQVGEVRQAVESFPIPNAGLNGLSLGMRGLARLTGAYEAGSFFVLGLALTCVAFAFLALTARVSGGSYRLKAALLILGPLGVLLLGNIGRHDALLVIGAAIIIMGHRQVLWSVLGTLVMVAANPEQTPIAAMAMVALTMTDRFRSLRRTAVIALATSTLAAGLLYVWSLTTPGGTTRADYIGFYFHPSLGNFIINAPLVIYSALGVLWLLWLGAVLWSSWRDRLFLMIAVSIPLIATAVTLDQTRVAVCVSSLVALCLAVHGISAADELLKWCGCGRPHLILGALAILAPSLEVTFAGHPRAPLGWIAHYLGLRG